jgi:hypothetical protein
LTRHADQLRDQLLADGASLKGDTHTAVIVPSFDHDDAAELL